MNAPLRIWHPFTNSRLDPLPIRVEKAQGVYLHTADGRLRDTAAGAATAASSDR